MFVDGVTPGARVKKASQAQVVSIGFLRVDGVSQSTSNRFVSRVVGIRKRVKASRCLANLLADL